MTTKKPAPTARAVYHVVEEDFTGDRVVLRDVGPWDRRPTVTNDADAVVADLLATSRVNRSGRIYYFDSCGEPNELRHDGTRFIGFGPWSGVS